MGRRTSSVSRGGIFLCCWGLFLLGSVVALVGCNPQSLSMLLMPFSDNKAEPEYKLCTAKVTKLVILTEFVDPNLLVRPEVGPAEIELPTKVASVLRIRSVENKQKLIIVPQGEVHNYLEKEDLREDYIPVEIGKHFKADYVLDLKVQALQVINKKSFPPVYQGRISMFVSLYKVNAKDEEPKVFAKSFSYGYPTESGTPAEVPYKNADPTEFRGMFLDRVARNVSRMFMAYDPDENHILE